ncbi:hypothetical protein CC80DRAFT_494081 [Byssothecium circinans]|uniref:Uncharacterized protein n=1 Tax=Byssothecium circinans TaxID=147558 RepID=A0A6A5TLR0_9PLEO|nr:hypothetical protein CC80DRAFT_494081 [Byssothecium circinans]
MTMFPSANWMILGSIRGWLAASWLVVPTSSSALLCSSFFRHVPHSTYENRYLKHALHANTPLDTNDKHSPHPLTSSKRTKPS